MKVAAPLAASLLLLACAAAEERPKIDVAKLANPGTQLHTLYEFIRASDTSGDRYTTRDFETFLEWHRDIAVTPLSRGGEPARYLASWRTGPASNDWGAVDAARHAVAASPHRILLTFDHVEFEVFAGDGTAELAQHGFVSSGNVADLNGDGEPEVFERSSMTGSGANPLFTECLTIRGLDIGSPAQLELIYNAHPLAFAATNTWSFQFVDPDLDGICELQLGPVSATGAIEPRVTFRWDAQRREWTGPPSSPGEHFKILAGTTFYGELAQMEAAGGIGYVLIPSPSASDVQTAIVDESNVDELPADQLSNPYRDKSLAALSHGALFKFMVEGKTLSDYAAEQKERITAVPDFWKLQPRVAALEYVRRNRPADIHANYLLTTYNPDNTPPPEEGELIYSDGPSGCGSPGGDFIHQLHCARAGSYLAFSGRVGAGEMEPLATSSFAFERVELPYEQARHLLQTTWWLSRVRAQQLAKSTNSYMSGGSTSDGSASTQFITAQENLTISAMRYAGHPHSFAGVGVFSEAYDPSAFTNLVMKLFHMELPKRLGPQWAGLTRLHQEEITRENEQRWKSSARELFASHREGRLTTAAIVPAVAAVGELGWQELRDEVEAVRTQLPPLLVHEQRVAQLEAELKALSEKLGPGADERGQRKRELRRLPGMGGFESHSGVDPGNDSNKPTASEVAEDERFATYDALVEKLRWMRWGTDPPEGAISVLRQTLPTTVRQLE